MANTVRAPELTTNLGWLNTDRPLRFSDELAGQVVVLDFWTYCCINCIHILPDLKFLEDKYRNEPVCFIGVHSAKFTNESSRETILAAILRYEIEHPVVIDENMKIWREYAARSWPTLVVVDSRGYVAAVTAGEGNRNLLDEAIAQALAQGKAGGSLAARPLDLVKEALVPASSGLRFPGKVLADEARNRLYVADSNHNRIAIAELPDVAGAASIVRVVGSGQVGSTDGPAETATFDHPQGLALGQGNLYVADTENHLIRAIDLDTYEVRTAVGTGEMCNDRAGGLMGVQQGLNSPWDLTIEGSTLYVAMAGTHQVWRIDMPVGFARAFAGSGRENLVDGPTELAALAQPSGICASGGHLYFADSEVSAIRGIDMNAEQVFTVIGEGLFSFGDVDGAQPQAKLQHPLGIDGWGSSLVVADTYNHKIKLVDPRAASVRTLYGTGQAGKQANDGGPAFFEPGGLSVSGDHVYVADTNNHRIVRINLKTNDWQEITLQGLAAPMVAGGSDTQAIEAAAVALAEHSEVELLLEIPLPEKAHMNADAPWSVMVASDGNVLMQVTGKSDSLPLRVAIPPGTVTSPTTWQISANYAYCNDDDGTCVPATVSWNLPVSPGGDSATATLRTRT
ncbi:MAG: thioredoxin-like domain-containing protein [Planctomycetota bacterium]|jgi:DNA-binding beta-propeller fold protein YncE